jgi:hypothetical protein
MRLKTIQINQESKYYSVGENRVSVQKVESVSNNYVIWITFIILNITIVTTFYLNLSIWNSFFLITGVLATVVIGLDLLINKVHLRSSTGLDFNIVNTFSFDRYLKKILGFILTITFVGVCYFLFREYHGDFYLPYWDYLKSISIPLGLLAPLYIWFIDRHMVEPEDFYYRLGDDFLSFNLANKNIMTYKQHFLGWVVKGFFLPLMLVYSVKQTKVILGTSLEINSFKSIYDFFYLYIFFIDLLYTIIGYTLSFRLFDNHIRSTEYSILGWIVALACYQPFWHLLESNYLHYGNSLTWGGFFSSHPVLYTIWGSLILILITIYTLSTVQFGSRFSNLTNRGIITNGTYRFFKHPAYISKNLSWWLISMPFIITDSFWDTLRNCLLLLLLNGIYVLRAYTEERHLSLDPSYVAYKEWMKVNGLIPILKRKLFKDSHEAA